METKRIDTVGFIGSGGINSRIARLAVEAGFHVLLSNSRGPESLRDLITELGPRAKAVTPAEAAEAADLVVLSVPFGKFDRIPVEPLVGKAVIDTMNYYPVRDGNVEALDRREITSSELIQAHLKGARLVKALYNLDMFHLENGARPSSHRKPWALPIAGDDDEAKALVSEFMERIGYEAVDCGRLADCWRIEADTPVYVLPYVGEMPSGLSKEDAMYWYKQDNAAVVGRDDVLRMAGQATRDFVVGGKRETMPSVWIDWIMWFNRQ
ncbi:hypothetical protein B0G57_12510 [Trinickia symbiotica]|uniref:Oxidoreductase n=1 Tax=Trinickia symbiotica TaxID=863227 RepID=A0A2N7WTB7_9BURK|nr:NAD(P)-binding domain-containing protein [Trinickia symbiotica]PMS32637.1 oxidoreductase [Trinickia symbiotica]PPK41745.1 hypothetical protein B0G57_12510 [Trinickia symbiotica]